jgi:hypothetical protein
MRALFIGGPEHLTEREVKDDVIEFAVFEPPATGVSPYLEPAACWSPKLLRYRRQRPVIGRSGRTILHIFVSEEV